MENILHIQIDTVPQVNQLIVEIQHLPLREQLARTSQFVQQSFKNATAVDGRRLPPDEVAKLKRVTDQDTPRPLSECLMLGYGYCVEYNVLAKVILDGLGIESEFTVCSPYPEIGHTFLDVHIDGQWEIFDPFAPVFLRDKGMRGTLLPDIWYGTSRTRKKE